jgi:hypothetical protein
MFFRSTGKLHEPQFSCTAKKGIRESYWFTFQADSPCTMKHLEESRHHRTCCSHSNASVDMSSCVCSNCLLTDRNWLCLTEIHSQIMCTSLWSEKVLWCIYSLLGNDSVYTFQWTHNNRSCVLCGPYHNSLLGNTTILDGGRRCFQWRPIRSYITRVSL